MASDVEKQQETSDELIEVFTTKNRGRGVRVTREVKAGCLLLTEEPFEFVVKNTERGYYCDQCLTKRDDILHKCSACRFAYYCNQDCQRAAWASHKQECEGISRVAPNVPSDHVRLMSRLSRKRKKQPAATANGSVTFPSHIDHLQSVPTDLRGDTQLEFSSWLYTLRRFMGEEANVMLPAEVLELFGRMRCNTCDVSDGELHSLGIGLYLKFSMFNHSCDYNCVAIHTGTSLSVRATRDILANKECFVCYVDVLKPTATRNAILRNVFQFMCKCHTCRDTKREQLRHSVRCGNQECREAVLLNPDGSVKKCSQCTFDSFPPDFSEQLKLVEQQCMAKLSAAEEIMSFGNWQKILQLSEQCLTLQKGVLHPYHHLVLETLHYAMDSCIHLEKWELALEYGLRSIEHIDFHCPDNNPNAAIQLMRVGKLQQYLTIIPEATTNLQKAENIMLITHGSDHPLFISLKEMLTGCGVEKRQMSRLESIEEAEPALEAEQTNKSKETVETSVKTDEDASKDAESALKDSDGDALKMDDANASQQSQESAAKSTDTDAVKVSNDNT